MRLRHEEVRGEDFCDDGADAWERQLRLPTAPTFVLEKAVRNSGQHDMVLPAGESAALEVIEPDFVLQLLVLLLDGPALMGEAHQRAREPSSPAG